MPAAELTTTQLVSLIGGAGAATFALLGVVATLWMNGQRTERQRRRELHARAMASIIAYGEMPYRIRRRAPGVELRSEDRRRPALRQRRERSRTGRTAAGGRGDRTGSTDTDNQNGKENERAGSTHHTHQTHEGRRGT